MKYKMRSLSGDDMFETLSAHVFARAYRTAWRVRHGNEPVGHVIPGLDLIIEFEGVQEPAILH